MKQHNARDLRMFDSGDGTLTGARDPDCIEEAYRFGVVTVAQAIDSAMAGQWDVPEFQREFVWKPAQACALADSLWRNYPIGPLLLWQATGARSNQTPLWIADGQQRLTTLCLLTGGTPSWFRHKPEQFCTRVQRRFDIRVDISARDTPRFIAVDARRRERDPRLLPIGRLMAIDASSRSGRNEMERLVRELKDTRYCRELPQAEIYRRLLRVSLIPQREMVATLINHRQRGDVLEIFARLNSRGMRFRRLLLKLMMEEIPAAIRGRPGRYQP